MFKKAEVFNEDPALNETVEKGFVVSLHEGSKTADIIPMNLTPSELLGLLFAVGHVNAEELIAMTMEDQSVQ